MKVAELTNILNFDYYLLSSPREKEVFSDRPVYLEPDVYAQMVAAAEVLYKLVERLTPQLLLPAAAEHGYLLPDFPMREEIINLPYRLMPFFWARYDAFERSEGGIFFSEFNYDKPCAQREIMVSNWQNPTGNPNHKFAENFRRGIAALWASYGSGKSRPTVGILIDPNHYEETHLAFLYADLLKPLDYQTVLLGGQNLCVRGNNATAFGKNLDIILRQYPTEFSHEVHDYPRLLKLMGQGRVLMLNDPRAIAPQAKSLFAYLWQLYLDHSACLSDLEREVIRTTIPYTRILTDQDGKQLAQEREAWVVKPIFGRYSEGVSIGAMLDQEEWLRTLEEISVSSQSYVMQEFVPIKRRVVSAFNGQRYEDCIGFGNYGVYFSCGEFSGLCVRWSGDYLSQDDVAWFSPVGVRSNPKPALESLCLWPDESAYRRKWNEIAMNAAFQFNYTPSYTSEWESFTLDAVRLSRSKYNELVMATEALGRIFAKTTQFIQKNLQLFAPLLAIPDSLLALLSGEPEDWLSILARFDWAIDRNDQLRLLEINTDTPAGLESSILNQLLHPYYPDCEDPNKGLGDVITMQFKTWLHRNFGSDIKTMGLIGCPSCEEDWFQLMYMREKLQAFVENVMIGDVSGLSVKEGVLHLYGQELQACYRHYPLEWLAEDQQYKQFLPALGKLAMINPALALITQSKAFLAVVGQLLEQGFYCPQEEQLIRQYVVPSYLDWPGHACVIKPYWGREGEGVRFSQQIKAQDMAHLAEQNLVYQDYVDIAPLDINLHNTWTSYFQAAYPILGAFLVGGRFGGLYTRLGARITNRYAVVAPTLVEV